VLGRVVVGRLIAASNVPAGAADAQMHPGVAGFKALLSAESAGRHVSDAIHV
jgi:hypothetical protein